MSAEIRPTFALEVDCPSRTVLERGVGNPSLFPSPRVPALHNQGYAIPLCIGLEPRNRLWWLVGNFDNGGREYQKQGEPVEVDVHDFKDKELGKASPYGIYDIGRNEGWVSVGISGDTAEFAVESIRH